MNKREKEEILETLGWFLVLTGLTVVIYSIYTGETWMMLWISYLTALIGGIGILKKNSLLVVSQLNIIALAFIIWNLDFFYFLIFGRALIITQPYFFNIDPGFALISLYHILALPAFIIAIYLLKIKEKNAWKISIPEIILVFFITRLATPPAENVNCIFHSCLSLNPGNYYPLLWLTAFPLAIFFTNQAIVRIKIFRAGKK